MNKPANIHGHKLAVIRGGRNSGPPVVFVHGISGSVNVWPAILGQGLKQRLNWCSISLPGHYPSTCPPDFELDDVTPELFSQSMFGEIESQFGDEPVHLVGWSTGGFAVLNLAATYPDRIASVLSIAGYAHGRWNGSLGWLQTMAHSGKIGRLAFRRFFARLSAHRSAFDQSMAVLAANKTAYTNSSLTKPVMDALFPDFRNHNKAVLAAMFARIRRFDITDSLSHVTANTMIVNGENDPAIPAAEAKWIAQNIEGSTLRIIPDCGHMFFAEAESATREILQSWFEKNQLL